MKETVITSRFKKQELYILLACTIVAYALNIIGIIKYSSPAKELITKIPLVLLIALLIYTTLAVLRIIYFLINKLWKK
jgi:hypothetical protein